MFVRCQVRRSVYISAPFLSFNVLHLTTSTRCHSPCPIHLLLPQDTALPFLHSPLRCAGTLHHALPALGHALGECSPPHFSGAYLRAAPALTVALRRPFRACCTNPLLCPPSAVSGRGRPSLCNAPDLKKVVSIHVGPHQFQGDGRSV